MGVLDKMKNFIAPVDDDYDEEELEVEEDEIAVPVKYEQPQTKGVTKLASDTKMVLFEPRSFDEAEEVAKHLKERRAAVVNLHRLQREYAQRTIDFLTGVVFALDGTIQKIGHNVILCTPKSIAVHGEITLDSNEESCGPRIFRSRTKPRCRPGWKTGLISAGRVASRCAPVFFRVPNRKR